MELKTVNALSKVHSAQLLTYLRMANAPVGLLLTFHTFPLGIRRMVHGAAIPAPRSATAP